jgi:glycosyltransferase involved in cell wall biosynthesis
MSHVGKEDALIIIPAYNEAGHIGALLEDLQRHGFTKLLVVDDGSADQTAALAEAGGAIVASHVINRGPGAATATGMHFARTYACKVAITIDADLQHDPEDIMILINAYNESGADLIIGSRFLSKDNNIPKIRIFYNGIANMLTRVFARYWVTDTQSGFKLFSKKALYRLDIKLDGYEFCSELVIKAHAEELSIQEVPIRVYYTESSMKKGQGVINGWRTFIGLVSGMLSKH